MAASRQPSRGFTLRSGCGLKVTTEKVVLRMLNAKLVSVSKSPSIR